MRVIGDAVESGDIKIVGEADNENWDPNNAYKNVENFLTRNNDDVQVILAMNDGMAGGVIQALIGRKLNGKVLVTGQDCELAACQRIVNNDQAMTVWKPENIICKEIIDACIAVASGKEVRTNTTVFNGYEDVPAILIDPVVVHKDNIESTVIASGYYSKQDIYAATSK